LSTEGMEGGGLHERQGVVKGWVASVQRPLGGCIGAHAVQTSVTHTPASVEPSNTDLCHTHTPASTKASSQAVCVRTLISTWHALIGALHALFGTLCANSYRLHCPWGRLTRVSTRKSSRASSHQLAPFESRRSQCWPARRARALQCV